MVGLVSSSLAVLAKAGGNPGIRKGDLPNEESLYLNLTYSERGSEEIAAPTADSLPLIESLQSAKDTGVFMRLKVQEESPSYRQLNYTVVRVR